MKKIVKIVIALAAVFVAALFLVVTYIVAFLPDVPLEEVKIEYTHERIKRGEYLAKHVANCSGCHSTRDWDRFGGPAVPGTEGKGGEAFDEETGYPGSYPASNITPFHLKDWTDAEILRAVTGGVSRNGRALFPVMPYPYYGKMDREDVYSIIAYLRSLPPVENEVPDARSRFPMNIIIKTIPSSPELSPKPSRADKIAYGRYLADISACVECHTPASRGRINEALAYSGGRFLQSPIGTVESSNITPDRGTGIGHWTEEAFVERFKAFDKENRDIDDSVSPGGFNSPMPWRSYAGMSEEDLAAIYAYLMSLKPIRNEVSKMKLTRKE